MSILAQPTKHRRVTNRFSSKGKQEKSRRQEEQVASSLGGRRQPGSGAFIGLKGDVKSDVLLIECKRTDKKSMSVKGEWLVKITKEAVEADRYPALYLTIDGVNPSQEWIMLPASVFEQLFVDKP